MRITDPKDFPKIFKLILNPNPSLTPWIMLSYTGTFEVSCRVTDHLVGGMQGQYTVRDCPGRSYTHTPFRRSRVVQYFISAEEIEWDYSPDRAWEQEKMKKSFLGRKSGGKISRA